MKKKKYILLTTLLYAIIGTTVLQANDAEAASKPYFPLIGTAHFTNDYYGARSKGYHRATDIFAAKHTPVIASVAGTVSYVNTPQASWGYSIGIIDSGGNEYRYIHMNNDTPGTDDGRGDEMMAYAPDMKVGNRVEQGQLLGYVGDSGNAENTPPHLHFEIEAPDGGMYNPYDHLIRWETVRTPSLYPPLAGETLPYWVKYNSGVNIATGDFNNDGESETVTGTGTGQVSEVRVFGENDNLNSRFYAYHKGFTGGVDVAAGDMEGDGIDEMITAPQAGESPLVRIFTVQGNLLGEFYAYDKGFKGGIRIASGDINGDGKDEIITAPNAGGGPWVRVFNVFGNKLHEFSAYNPSFRGGVDVAVADTEGDISKEILAGPGKGGGPWLCIYKPDGTKLKEFLVYDSKFKGGIRVSGGNVKADLDYPKDELMTIPATYGESRIRLMKNTGENVVDYPYLEKWWKGNYDVAAGEGMSRVATGVNRRGSIRFGPK